MATLKVWNIEDELVLSSKGMWHEAEGVLFDYMRNKDIGSSGGYDYTVKVNDLDAMILIQDELEDEDGATVGRYEIKEG